MIVEILKALPGLVERLLKLLDEGRSISHITLGELLDFDSMNSIARMHERDKAIRRIQGRDKP